jgi:integrase
MLNRPELPPPLPVPPLPPSWDDVDTRPWVRGTLGPPATAYALPPGTAQVQLLEARSLPRELEPDEVAALLAAAPPDALPVLAALLSGVDVDELVALDRGDIDRSVPVLRLPDRGLALAGPLRQWLAGADGDAPAPDAPLLADAQGQRLSGSDIDAIVVVAAHDAGLARAGEIDAAALRHTYVAHLVRQGARFSDLARWAGKLPLAALARYGPLAPAGPKRPADDIDPMLPALRRLATRPAQ